MTDAVLYDCKDGLARITLNRPDARNALNIAMCEALIAATRRAREDAARCVLVQGGWPGFLRRRRPQGTPRHGR